MSAPRPVLQTIVAEAIAGTGARAGWLLHRDGGRYVVAAFAGEDVASSTSLGDEVELRGARGYSVASGQPAALVPQSDDQSNDGVGGYLGVPPSLLVAEAGEGLVLLELAAKRDGSAFTFDDIDVASSLAEVAAAAVQEVRQERAEPPPPARLAAELHALAARDEQRYRDVAALVVGLLGIAR